MFYESKEEEEEFSNSFMGVKRFFSSFFKETFCAEFNYGFMQSKNFLVLSPVMAPSEIFIVLYLDVRRFAT